MTKINIFDFQLIYKISLWKFFFVCLFCFFHPSWCFFHSFNCCSGFSGWSFINGCYFMCANSPRSGKKM